MRKQKNDDEEKVYNHPYRAGEADLSSKCLTCLQRVAHKNMLAIC